MKRTTLLAALFCALPVATALADDPTPSAASLRDVGQVMRYLKAWFGGQMDLVEAARRVRARPGQAALR